MNQNVSRTVFTTPRTSGDVNTPGLGVREITIDGITDTTVFTNPVVFKDDYSTNYVARSVVDKTYVDGIVAAKVKTGTAAPAVAPDFVGQIYIDTNNENIYIAVDTANAADFVQVNNA